MQYPVVNTVEELAKALAEDLSSRGILTADRVMYGSAKPSRQLDPPRVWVELSQDFSVSPSQAGRVNHGPGMRADVAGQPYPLATRSLWQVTDQAIITVFARVSEEDTATPPPQPQQPRGDTPARLAQLATSQLRARVLASLYRVYKGGIQVPITGEWVAPENAEFQYGSVCRLYVGVYTEIPDDASFAVPVPAVEITVKAVLPAGDYTAAVVTAPDT